MLKFNTRFRLLIAWIFLVGVSACNQSTTKDDSVLPTWESPDMQSGALYYPCSKDITLLTIQRFLKNELKLKTILGVWRAGLGIENADKIKLNETNRDIYVVKQLRVPIRTKSFLIQLNNDEYVMEEAKYFAGVGLDKTKALSATQAERLASFGCRLEIGGGTPTRAIEVDGEVISFVGFGNFSVSGLPQKRILLALNEHLNGMLFDNMNGVWFESKTD